MGLITKKTGLISGALLITYVLMAQEIPSRTNEGVSSAAPREARKNAYFNLKLTKEQQKELQVANKENREKMKEIAADSTLEPKERKNQLQAVRKDLIEKRRTILTEEQYTMYEQNLKEIKEKGLVGSAKNVVNNIEKNREKDPNGLSRDAEKKTSKKGRSNWNDLQMTGEQREKMRLANQDYNTRAQTIRNNISLTSSEKQDQTKEAYRAYEMEIRSILTSEQKSKWDDQQRRARMTMSSRELQADRNRRGVSH
ncbi:hypothetical protein U0035_16565 [Niabella yanshanensis]|uniref:DUF4890 domain-containing protein n=1 Tax=Niabella yanshanensis TaxID=577386 RepID=A0ABZ0W2X9_9BACT|nr:hypothetical protein [Niabella yanshanensis]WQD37284.1 hypothetical protein U0035_16565 [Niabella yanshanensis]